MSQTANTEYNSAQTPVFKHDKCFICKLFSSKYACSECKSGHCEGCRQIHNKRFEFDNHTITDMRDESTVVYCMTHQGKEYNVFCSQCSKLLCEECLIAHKDHKISKIPNVADDMRQTAEKYVKLLHENVENISAFLSRVESEKLPNFKEEIHSRLAEIDVAAQAIHGILKSKQNIKRAELNDFEVNHVDGITSYLKKKETTLADMKNLKTRLNNALAERHNVSFIISYEYLKKDLKETEQELLEGFTMPKVPERNLDELVLDLVQLMNTDLERENKAKLEELQLECSGVTKEKEEFQLQLKEMKLRHSQLEKSSKQAQQLLEDKIKDLEEKQVLLEFGSENALELVNKRDDSIEKLKIRVDILLKDVKKKNNVIEVLSKEKIESYTCIADIYAEMQDWQLKSKQTTEKIELQAKRILGFEHGVKHQDEINQDKHEDPEFCQEIVDSDAGDMSKSEHFSLFKDSTFSNTVGKLKVEDSKLLVERNDILQNEDETKDSDDIEEPIDAWLRKKDLKECGKHGTNIQLQQFDKYDGHLNESGIGTSIYDEDETLDASFLFYSDEAEITVIYDDKNQDNLHLTNGDDVLNASKSLVFQQLTLQEKIRYMNRLSKKQPGLESCP